MSDSRCNTCRFFVTGLAIGTCRRYPQVENKHEKDWCGEHQERVIISLPVYDIMTDETKVAEMPAKVDPVMPERKKPGRKPKNDAAPTA